jgi:uncharacterized Zn-binding protein involved in type VI secretion
MHTCPMVTVLVPHVGGPITAPGCPTVLIGGLPAARVSDMATCVGPPDAIAAGSPTVLIGGMMAARVGDLTVHGGAIVLGEFTVLIGGAGAAPSLGLALQLLKTGGTADASDVALVAQELAKMPPSMLQAMINQGTKVVVCRGSVTEYRADLRGVQPRGWPAGATWDTVPGAYMGDANETVVATRGHGTPAGAHVPKTGEGHGSSNLVIHESTHAVDHQSDGTSRSATDPNFTAARNADSAGLSAYESQAGSAGQEETYAESSARYYGNDPSDAAKHPNLNGYWATDPVAPAAGGSP